MACALAAISAGCKNNDQSDVETIKYVESTSMDDLLDHVKSVDLIPIMLADEEKMMGPTIEMQRTHDSFLVYDMRNYKIMRYGDNGQLLNPVGRVGRGPGEYSMINDIQIVGDTIVVFSYPGMILKYGMNGEWLGTDDCQDLGQQSVLVDDGILIYYGYVPEQKDRLALQDRAGNVKESYLPTKSNTIPYTSSAPIFSFNQKDAFVIDSFSDTLYKYTSAGLEPYLRFNFGKYAVDDSFYSEKDPYLAAESLLSSSFGSISRYLESDKYKIAELMINSPDNPIITYCMCREGEWLWFGEKMNSENSFFNGSIKDLKDNVLYCVFQPEAISKLAKFFSDKIVNSDVVESMNIDQLNFAIAEITLD